jgi:hypothetical protein
MVDYEQQQQQHFLELELVESDMVFVNPLAPSIDLSICHHPLKQLHNEVGQLRFTATTSHRYLCALNYLSAGHKLYVKRDRLATQQYAIRS